MASLKFAKTYVRASSCMVPCFLSARSATCHAGSSCASSGAICSPVSGGTPPRHGTHWRCASSFISVTVLDPCGHEVVDAGCDRAGPFENRIVRGVGYDDEVRVGEK